jgi:hypothetical protein
VTTPERWSPEPGTSLMPRLEELLRAGLAADLAVRAAVEERDEVVGHELAADIVNAQKYVTSETVGKSGLPPPARVCDE